MQCYAYFKKKVKFLRKQKKILIKMTFLAVVWFLQLSLRLLSHFKAFLESLYYESYCQLILQPEVE